MTTVILYFLAFACVILLVSTMVSRADIRDLSANEKSLNKEIEELTNNRNALIEKYKDIEDEKKHLAMLKQEEKDIEWNISLLKNEENKKFDRVEELSKELSSMESEVYCFDCGITKINFQYGTTQEYQDELSKIKEKEKNLIKEEKAVKIKKRYFINDSKTEGEKFRKRNISLLLGNFNGECDKIISAIKWNNYNASLGKIEKSFEKINQKGEVIEMEISKEYKKLKIAEAKLEFERKELEHKLKEEEKARKEKYAEEQRELKKLEEDRERAEREEKHYVNLLEKAKKDISNAIGVKYDEIAEKIKWYKEQLKEAKDNKERALSMAQQTRRGYVYIISNIGSFGERVYKIGLTRRLDPYERVKELSNASVPFKFDVHAMIYSEDAPNLESALHNIFDKQRVNKINAKKEYFKVSLDEIKKKVKELGYNAEFVEIPDDFAREYYETKNIEKLC